jgi:hypothetical protein
MARKRQPGEGDSQSAEFLETPPHPDPLPASGARESIPSSARPSTVIVCDKREAFALAMTLCSGSSPMP